MRRKLRLLALVACVVGALVVAGFFPIPVDDAVPLAVLKGKAATRKVLGSDVADAYRIDHPYKETLAAAEEELSPKGWTVQGNPEYMSAGAWLIRPFRFGESTQMRLQLAPGYDLIDKNGKTVYKDRPDTTAVQIFLPQSHPNTWAIVADWFHRELGTK